MTFSDCCKFNIFLLKVRLTSPISLLYNPVKKVVLEFYVFLWRKKTLYNFSNAPNSTSVYSAICVPYILNISAYETKHSVSSTWFACQRKTPEEMKNTIQFQ